MPEWQALSAQNPAEAANEFIHRVTTRLSPAQRTAIFADIATEGELTAMFERVANTIAPYAGTPYVLKDIFYLANQPLRAGSAFPPGLLPVHPRDSKLPHALRGYGAILAGRTHLHEFAYGLTGENPHHGDCTHPRFPERTSGGSSSGSAVAVAAGIVPFAVGTDTGGSIRVPSAFCGLYGFRTSAHHPLIEDAFPLAPDFDTAGWMTRDADDLIALNRFLLGKPQVAAREPKGCFLNFVDLQQPADEDIAIAYEAAARKISTPADEQTASHLARAFTGSSATYAVLQSHAAFKVHVDWLDAHRAHYSEAVWQRIDRGRRWSDNQLAEARAQLAAQRLVWQSYFQTCDYLILPATPFAALRKDDCTQYNRERLLALNTPVSLAGLPVLSIPIALPSSLHTGLQVVVNSTNSPVIAWALKRFLAR